MKHRDGFTLTEMLIVTAVTVSVLSLVSAFFVDGWSASHRTLRRIDHNQIVPIIMKKWQAFLKPTSPDSWQLQQEEGAFKAGRVRVWQGGNHLLFVSGGKTNAMRLPTGSKCSFSIEAPANMAACAVMTVTWPSEYVRSSEINLVRFVACGRRQ